MFYLVWDKYLETTGIMQKEFETGHCIVDTVNVISSYYATKVETQLETKVYKMNNASDMEQVENRYKVIREYYNN